MNARNKIKSLIALRCLTITKLAQMMREATGKLQRGTLSLDEAYIIADLLDYKLEFTDNKN